MYSGTPWSSWVSWNTPLSFSVNFRPMTSHCSLCELDSSGHQIWDWDALKLEGGEGLWSLPGCGLNWVSSLQIPGTLSSPHATSRPPSTRPTSWICTQRPCTVSACTPSTRLAAVSQAKSLLSALRRLVSSSCPATHALGLKDQGLLGPTPTKPTGSGLAVRRGEARPQDICSCLPLDHGELFCFIFSRQGSRCLASGSSMVLSSSPAPASACLERTNVLDIWPLSWSFPESLNKISVSIFSLSLSLSWYRYRYIDI